MVTIILLGKHPFCTASPHGMTHEEQLKPPPSCACTWGAGEGEGKGEVQKAPPEFISS